MPDTAPAPPEHVDLWVCYDCHAVAANGGDEIDGRFYPDGSDTPTDCPPWSLPGVEEATNNTYPDGDNPYDPDETGEREFSWSSCQACGSTLGGSRYRYALTL
jgi:hypothetical protein